MPAEIKGSLVSAGAASRIATLKLLVGSGDRIMLLAAPFAVAGVALNVAHPSWFGVGGPSPAIRAISIVVLASGVVTWAWSVWLIVRNVPRGELITTGPFSLVKHPLYTAVALLVLPWLGLLLDSWLGALLGAVVYGSSRMLAPAEEAELATAHGPRWDEYRRSVKLPWL